MVDQDIRQMTDELAALLQRKRDQYGTGNLAVFGEYGILVRVFDKVYRLRNLHDKNKEPQDESIDDTWFDIAGYSILALLERRSNANRLRESH